MQNGASNGARGDHGGRPFTIGSPLRGAHRFPLMRLVWQAWDLKDTPYFIDACKAIVDWWERERPARIETYWRHERLIQLLRETAP
jgi:hypothetical protein